MKGGEQGGRSSDMKGDRELQRQTERYRHIVDTNLSGSGCVNVSTLARTVSWPYYTQMGCQQLDVGSVRRCSSPLTTVVVARLLHVVVVAG